MKHIQLIAAASLVLAGACKDDSPKLQSDAKMIDAKTPDGPSAPTYAQVEQLARPGINEALLRTNAFLNGYNATAPSFAGVPTATLDAVVAEAKGTLQAIYLGVCLSNGLAGLTAANGLKPAGMQCAAVGTAVFQENTATGVTISAAAGSGASTYADAVFGLFEPDVMRIDTSVTSGYLGKLCGSGSGAPLLCGGRQIADDVIDITYDFLIDGANEYLNPVSPPTALSKQIIALTSDGVVYNNANGGSNPTSIETGVATNSQQGHPAVTNTFPFSAPPI